ncbi:hypothetical protein J4G02_18245 [Candidatus Poribacteria bacterium]|nr:hypothetical protein [Candidatus Poribacteria bacterium]
MVQILLGPDTEKKLNALKDDLDFIMNLEEFIEEEYHLAFELKYNAPESYADSLKKDLGDERYQEFCRYLQEKRDEKDEARRRFDREANGIQ